MDPTMPRCRGLRSTLLRMGVNNPSHVLRKKVASSDISKEQHRLLLPKDPLNYPVFEGTMTAEEKTQTTGKSGLRVKVLGRLGREYDLTLRFVASIGTYRIMGPDYTKLVEENGFQVGDFLDLWVFRVGQQPPQGELRMAMEIECDDQKAEEEREINGRASKKAAIGHEEELAAARTLLRLGKCKELAAAAGIARLAGL